MMSWHAKLSRRELAALCSAGLLRAAAGSGGIKIGMAMRSLSDEFLRFLRQLGVEWVALPGLSAPPHPPSSHVPPAGRPPSGSSAPWKEAEVVALKRRIERAGLRLGNLALHGYPNAILGTPERDRDIENVRESIRVAGRAGIPVLEYNFYGLRASEGYYTTEGRGGAHLTAFDYSRVKDKPPLAELGPQSEQEMWSRLTYFVKAIMPAAEEAGVRMALHPNDPPVPVFRGVAQQVGSIEGLKRLVDIVPRPVNGITFDTGVATEMGGDVVELIRYFGRRDQINHVHFRNVRVDTPRYKYSETFIDDGQADLLRAMKAFREVGYSGMMVPDHTPAIDGDTADWNVGWAFALGYMKALLRASE